MLTHNSIDLQKVYRERVKPELTPREAAAMERALEAPPLQALFTTVADKVHWYLLHAPSFLTGRHYGVAASREEAEEIVSRLLGSTTTHRGIFA